MRIRTWIVGLSAFGALSALGGGIELLAWPTGNAYLPIELLQPTPFETFLVPGLLLTLVVGGSSLTCTVLAWRRSAFAIDATLFCGGVHTFWIVSEVALLQSLHWLHVVYALLGVALLGLGVRSAWREKKRRCQWVVAVTLGESIGYLGPTLVGVLSYGAIDDVGRIFAMAAAGLWEGLCLGAAQAWALPLDVNRRRFAGLTAVAASLVWASVMTMMVLMSASDEAPGPAATVGLLVAGCAALLSIGGAQWLELRHRHDQARSWVLWTGLAWLLALPLSFLPSPLVDEATPLPSHLGLWGSAGVLMAYVMALTTWQGVRRLATVRRAGSDTLRGD